MASSRLLALLLTAAVGLIPIAPPEHVHEVDDHGHVEFVVHRHAQLHSAPDHVALHHRGPDVDHQDPPIATLDQDYLVPTTVRVPVATHVVVVAIVDRPQSIRIGLADFVERLIHGPPRAPTDPRGPPSILAS